MTDIHGDSPEDPREQPRAAQPATPLEPQVASQPAAPPASAPPAAAPPAAAPPASPAPPYPTPAPGTGSQTTPVYDAPYGPRPPLPAPPTSGTFGPASQTQPTVPLSPAFASSASTTMTARPKSSSAGRVAGLLLAAALVGGAAGFGGSFAGTALWSPVSQTGAQSPGVVTVNDTDSVNNITGVAAKVTPSVVTISASSSGSGGTGSGVILSDDGYILTNTHVVTLDGVTADPALSVTTADGSVYAAKIVGTDPTYDLAVIRLVDATGLTAIEWGDSTSLNVGDGTIAIGAPLGLSNTVTTGIVSALNRSIEIASSAAPDSSDNSDQTPDDQNGQNGPFQFDFGQGGRAPTNETIKIAVIQTDASINPGNSGGALVDSAGKLIGINVAIASTGSTSGGQSGSIGVGFSIPSSVAQRVSDEIIDSGSATHGLLGASVQDAANVTGSTITGAYIAEVSGGGAAEAAGLRADDTVTAFNGVPISDSVDLTAQVRAAAAGSDATVTYVRAGQTRTVDVTLGTLGQ